MATSSDPRASGFNADDFRDAIRFAMSMGLPEATSERVTFRWTSESQYSSASPTNTPYDLTAAPTTTASVTDLPITAAVEFVTRASLGDQTSIGNFENPRAVITLLDEDYTTVVTAGTDAGLDFPDEVLLGGNTYKVNFVEPPVGLFGVTVYSVHATAVDES